MTTSTHLRARPTTTPAAGQPPAPRPCPEEDGGIVVRGPTPDGEAVSVETVAAALKAGARGYIFNGFRTRAPLVGTRAGRTDGDGDGDPTPDTISSAGGPPLFTVPDVNGSPRSLTAHEIAILQHVASGATSKLIGSRLGLSPGAVKSQLHRTGCRLGTTDRAQMVLLAMRAGAVV